MIELYKKIEQIWFKINQKIRFLLVGGFNTVFAYGVFVGLYQLAGLNYNLALITQYFITVNVSIFTMRYYVFQSSGNIAAEYAKAGSVYVGMYFFNAFALNFFVIVLKFGPVVGQALYLVVSTIITYILHKYFSFRNKKA